MSNTLKNIVMIAGRKSLFSHIAIKAICPNQMTSIMSYRYYSNDIKEQLEKVKNQTEIETEITKEITNDQANDNIEDEKMISNKIITSNIIKETNLHSSLKNAFIKNIGTTLTPVQEQCINEFISSENGIVVRAKTGTGKTFAFGIPVMHSVLTSKDQNRKNASNYVNSVVFSPTRDLAFQTRKSLTDLWSQCLISYEGGKKAPRVGSRDRNSYRSRIKGTRDLIPLVIGQTPYNATMSYFGAKESPPIVVATPGRFMDMLENEPKFRNSFKHLQNIIIDEADELLNGNFKEDINKIIDKLNEIREPIPQLEDPTKSYKPKTMLFSATVNDDVFDLAERAISNDFPFVDVTGNKTEEVNENITQTLVKTETMFDTYVAATKFILDNINNKHFKPIIFLSTTSSVEFVSKLLKDVLLSEGINRRVLAFHGKLPQGRRDSAQRNFRELSKAILVASGIGARGMDFPNVSHVIQIGVSSEVDSHTHKIGRTGRAGKQGDALLFTSKLEEPFVKALVKNGNKFSEIIEFNGEELSAVAVANKIKDQTRSYLDLDETFFKFLTHYRNIPSKVANLDLNKLAIDVANTYSNLVGENINENDEIDQEDDENDIPSRLRMSYTTAKHLGLDWRSVGEYYELTGKRPNDSNSRGNNYSNNRSFKRNDWSKNGRNDRNDRNDRNERNYRNDRNNRNDRYDRNDRNRHGRGGNERSSSRW